MMAMRPAFAILCVTGLLLAACDGSGGVDGPGSVSVDEAQALDEAAEMLEERRLPEGALPEVAPPASTAEGGTGEDLAE